MINADISKKIDLVKAIASRSGDNQTTTETILDTFVDYLVECFEQGKSVHVSGLGTFEIRTRKAKRTCNPLVKNKVVEIPEMNVIHFKASKQVKDSAKKSMGR